MEREVGGGIGMGNTCKPMAVSFQCMTKSTTNKKKKIVPVSLIDNSSCVIQIQHSKKKKICRELLGGLVVRTWCFHCGVPGSFPGQGTKIPQARWCGQKKKPMLF